MFYIAVCDDEAYFLEREKQLVASYMSQHGYECSIELFLSGEELLEGDIRKYDIIFLDISMHTLDGIETARQIRKYTQRAYLVFVTAYITYSLEGYKVDAIRFILKDDDCLEKAIEECLNAIIVKADSREEKLLFKFQEGSVKVKLDQIVYVESYLHKLIFHMNSDGVRKYNMYEKLDVIAEQLISHGFCRIHKSYLVNLKYISGIERYHAILLNGKNLNIAKPRYPLVRADLIAYRGEL